MTNIVMGNVAPYKERIRELEQENRRLKFLLADLQRPPMKKSFFEDEDHDSILSYGR